MFFLQQKNKLGRIRRKEKYKQSYKFKQYQSFIFPSLREQILYKKCNTKRQEFHHNQIKLSKFACLLHTIKINNFRRKKGKI